MSISANNHSTLRPNLKKPIHLLAFGFGSGLFPKAPGTMGTLVAILPWWYLSQQSLLIYAVIVLLSSIAGIYICGETSRDLKVHDHSGIVWDEFCGFWLTMFAVPAQWQWLIAGFCLFRFFDIVKPWPIKWIDQKVSGGFGIMLDDIIAGVFSLLILQAILYYQSVL